MMINKWDSNSLFFSIIYSIEMTHFLSHSTIMCLKQIKKRWVFRCDVPHTCSCTGTGGDQGSECVSEQTNESAAECGSKARRAEQASN